MGCGANMRSVTKDENWVKLVQLLLLWEEIFGEES